MSVVLDNSIDYKPDSLSHGSYVMHRIFPNKAAPATISPAGGEQLVFEISSQTMNLSKSVLRFGLSPTDAPSVNTYSNKMYASNIPLRSIEITTRSGLVLAQINDLDMYSDLVFGYEKLEDAMTNDFPTGAAATLANCESCQGVSLIGAASAANQTLTGIATQKANIARRGVFVGTANTALSPNIMYEIRLDKIRNSIFDRGLDMLFPEMLYLTITFLPVGSTYFEATTASNANINVQANQTLTLSNAELLLAKQTNLMIQQDLLNAVGKGMEIDIDFIRGYKQSFGAVTSHNMMISFNGAPGSRLKYIYWTAYPSTQTLQNRYNNATSVSTLSTFNTYLNSNMLEQFTMTPTYAYITQKDELDGTITSDKVSYLNKFTYIQDFCGKTIDGKFYIDGMPLDNTLDLRYEVNSTNSGATALMWYVFTVVSRKLKISNSMVELI